MALTISKPISTFSRATAVAAAFSLLATPAVAVELPRPVAAKAFDGEALNVERSRRRWHRGRDDIDAGDVIAGVVILGAIAAIAGAAKRDRAERYPTEYPDSDRDWDRDGDARYRSSADDQAFGLDRAVDVCVDAIERDHPAVANIDSVSRLDNGWRVLGEVERGTPFECTIGEDGRVSSMFVGDRGVAYEPAGEGAEEWRPAQELPESDEADGDFGDIALAPG